MSDRFAFFNDAPDLTGFAWPDGGPEDVGDAAPPTSRVQIAKTGRFTHPLYGKFAVTPATFDSFVANFTAGIPTDELPVDFDHLPDKGGSSAACGWIKAFEPDGDALFAIVEWNWDGAFAIREKVYRYVSPTWSMNFVDEAGEKRGPTMLAFGLTNRPYFTMPAVSLSRTFAREQLELAEEEGPAPAAGDPVLFDAAFNAAIREKRVRPEQKASLSGLFAHNPGLALETLSLLRRVG